MKLLHITLRDVLRQLFIFEEVCISQFESELIISLFTSNKFTYIFAIASPACTKLTRYGILCPVSLFMNILHSAILSWNVST